MLNYNHGNKYNQNLYAKTKHYQKLYGFKIGAGSPAISVQSMPKAFKTRKRELNDNLQKQQ